MSGQSTPARATPPKRLTLTPGPRPLHLGTGSFSLASPSKVTSPLATPPTTAPLPRRMGSVSYQTRDDFQLGQRQEGASLTRGGSLREFGGRRGRGHAASASVASGEGSLERAQQEALERKRRSASALDDQPPPPVLTLAEKHKDLLHFIAQKESKCVELRAQLAAHEADLLQLKKKWEKIVAKGNDRQARTTSGSGAVDLVRGIFGGLGELAIPSSSTAHTPPTPSSSASTPAHASPSVLSTSPFTNAKPSLTTTASRAASKGHLMHTPHSSSSSNSTGISSVNTTRLSLSSASSLGGAELFKEEAPKGDDDDPDAWGPFETAHTEEPESISGAGSALGLSGVEVQSPRLPSAVAKIPGAEAVTKSTKRASTLLSDVSTAWTTTLNALAPPPAPSLTKPSGMGGVAPRPSPTIRLTTSKPTASPTSSKPTPTRSATLKSTTSKPSKPSPAPISTSNRPVSLLDDDDGAGDSLGAVLQPSPSASVRTKLSDAASTKTASDPFGDDWNW